MALAVRCRAVEYLAHGMRKGSVGVRMWRVVR